MHASPFHLNCQCSYACESFQCDFFPHARQLNYTKLSLISSGSGNSVSSGILTSKASINTKVEQEDSLSSLD